MNQLSRKKNPLKRFFGNDRHRTPPIESQDESSTPATSTSDRAGEVIAAGPDPIGGLNATHEPEHDSTASTSDNTPPVVDAKKASSTKNILKQFLGKDRNKSPPIQSQNQPSTPATSGTSDRAGEVITSGPVPIDTSNTTPELERDFTTSTSDNAQPVVDDSHVSNTYLSVVSGTAPAQDAPSPQDRVRESAGTVYAAFILTLKGIKEASGMLPPLKTAAAALLAVMGIVEQTSQNQEDFKKLNQNLLAVKAIVEMYHKPGSESLLNKRIRDLTEAIEFQAEHIKMLHSRSRASRLALSEKDAGMVKQSFQNISVLLTVFQMDTSLDTNTGVQEVLELLRREDTEKTLHALTCAENVSYNNRLSVHDEEPQGCMEGTRVIIVDELLAWARSDKAPKVYWLNGPAGAGKSTISHTFCERLAELHLLGASFFCYRSSEQAANARSILPTIARRLAASSPRLRVELINALKDDTDLAKSHNVQEHFLKLIYRPLCRVNYDSHELHKVVIIEAPDECSSSQIVVSLIQIVMKHAKDLPLKIFISSRPDPWIQEAFDSCPSEVLIRRNIVHDLVLNDIETYLLTSLSRLGKKRSKGSGKVWPPPEQVAVLAKQSDPLFIYAATALRYVSQRNGNHTDRLKDITKGVLEFSRSPIPKLYDLYAFIMKQASEGMNQNEIYMQDSILKAVLFLRIPLSVASFGSLLEMEPEEVHIALSPFHSVLHVAGVLDLDGVIFPLHASFRDYLCDKSRSRADRSLKPEECHLLVAFQCLKCMNRELHHWQLAFGLIPESAGSAVQKRSPPGIDRSRFALAYSCIHWASHLEGVQNHQAPNLLKEILLDFMEKRLLDWFACLGALEELQVIRSSLSVVVAFTLRLNTEGLDINGIKAIAEDASQLAAKACEPLTEDYLEAYRSCITWLPIDSHIRQIYAQSLKLAPRVLGLDSKWEAMDQVIQNKGGVISIAFSHDSTRVVSASSTSTIVRVWNVTTGQLEIELTGHTHWVIFVAFSPDSSQVVSVSRQNTVRIWSTTTGQLECELNACQIWVFSVAFSPERSQLVSGSRDTTVRIWNLVTGQLEKKLTGHSQEVKSVAFSPDSTRVASGSRDKTVRIWNAKTWHLENILDGHSDSVTSVTFSPDSSRVASGSADTTTRIWTATTGHLESILYGHSDSVTSVAFSPDSSRVASGSTDKTVRIWNATTGQLESELTGHSVRVNSVAFSPDSRRVASGSDDSTLRIWNATAGQLKTKDNGRLLVFSVSFSPDSSRVVSGSETVRIWNAITGEMENELIGHFSWVKSVAFSPDGNQVVSGSEDGTARIWNATTGQSENRLSGHLGSVNSVAFSPDGSRVVSGSEDGTARIWNATTGQLESKLTITRLSDWETPTLEIRRDKVSRSGDRTAQTGLLENQLTSHSDSVNSVAFSPDGSRVVSGSNDGTARIWNATTGQLESTLNVHRHWATSVFVFSPDGNHIVSGDSVNKVCLWSVTTGQLENELSGHSGYPMTSVAIFPKDDQLAYESEEGSQWIFNLITGKSVLASTSESEHKETTTSTTRKALMILYISQDRRWAIGEGGRRLCWIAPQYREYVSLDICGSKACFGQWDGRVVVLDVNPNHQTVT